MIGLNYLEKYELQVDKIDEWGDITLQEWYGRDTDSKELSC